MPPTTCSPNEASSCPCRGSPQLLQRTAWRKGLRSRSRSSAAIGSRNCTILHPRTRLHIQHFLSANCFGDHYTRTGIDVPTRELLTFSMLVSLGGCEAQVKGHVAANLNVGNDRARLIDVLPQLLPFIGYPRTLNALRVVDEVTAS